MVSMRHVVLIAGPPCAGKTTLAQELAEQRPGRVVDRDLIARGLGSARGWLHEPGITAQAEQLLQAELERIAGSEDVVAYVVRSVPERAARAALAERLRADEVIVLDPGADECVRRAARDGRPRGTVAAIRLWYRRARPGGGEQQPSAPRLATSRRW